MTDLANDGADQRVIRKTALRQKAEVGRDRRHEHDGIDMARVVGRENGSPHAVEVFDPGDPRPHAAHPEGHATPPFGGSVGPAPRRTDQQVHPQHAQRGHDDRHDIRREQQPPYPVSRSSGAQAHLGEGQSHLLHDERPPPPEGPAPIRVANGAVPDLAARRLQHSAWTCDHHGVGRHANGGGHLILHGRAEPIPARAIALPRLCHDDETLGATRGIVNAQCRDASLADARRGAGGFLDLLRADVAARLNDDVLDAAGNEQLTIRPIAEIARIHPALVHHRARRLRVPEVTARHRRPAELHVPFGPLAQRLSGCIDDANLMVGQRPATRHESQGMRIGRVCGAHLPTSFERLTDERLHAGGPIDRRHGERHRRLGKPVHRAHRARLEAKRRESSDETLNGVSAHCFRAVHRQAPAPEVQPLDVVVGDLVDAEIECEVRGRRHGA